METIIKKQKKPFSQIDNSWIISKDLSDAAFRLLCYIEMQSESWIFYKEEIKKRFSRGEDKYAACMKLLKKNGHILHYPARNKSNKIINRVIEMVYEIKPEGVISMQWTSNSMDDPSIGKPPQYNNTNNNNNNNINNNINLFGISDNSLELANEKKKNIHDRIFNKRNSMGIKYHESIKPDMQKHIDCRLKEYTEEEIIKSIENYASIVNHPQSWYTHKRTLQEFMGRELGMKKFLYEDISNYVRENWKDRPSYFENTVDRIHGESFIWYAENYEGGDYITRSGDSIEESRHILKTFNVRKKILKCLITGKEEEMPPFFKFEPNESDKLLIGFNSKLNKFYLTMRGIKVVIEYSKDQYMDYLII